MFMPGHNEMESSGVPITGNAAYELPAPLEENLYDYISPMDMHQGTAMKSPSLPKERESGYVISGLYEVPKDIEDGYVIPNLEMSLVTTNSNDGSAPFLAEDGGGYVIANLSEPLQTTLLPQNSTSEPTSDLSLPPAAQGENAVSELPTAAPQLQDSERDLGKETRAMSDIYNSPPDDSPPHKTTDEDVSLATTSQLLDEEKYMMVLS